MFIGREGPLRLGTTSGGESAFCRPLHDPFTGARTMVGVNARHIGQAPHSVVSNRNAASLYLESSRS